MRPFAPPNGQSTRLFTETPLRLVHVIEPGSEAVRLETEYAETALRAACVAVEATGKQVKVETAIPRGGITAVLADESRNAAMICVGSFGIGFVARKILGSTAAALAQSAHCPVAVIRTPHVSQRESGCIAVVINDSRDSDSHGRGCGGGAATEGALIGIGAVFAPPASPIGSCPLYRRPRLSPTELSGNQPNVGVQDAPAGPARGIRRASEL